MATNALSAESRSYFCLEPRIIPLRNGKAELRYPNCGESGALELMMNDQSWLKEGEEPWPGLAPKKYEGKRITDKVGTGCS
jgi:hypothetical protein